MIKANFTKGISCFIVIAILLLAGTISVQVHADGPPPQVQRVAEEGLARFLATLPADELARIGLATAEDVQTATLGAPYEQLTLTPETLAAYQPGTSLSTMLTGTDTWLFPVMVHGEARTMLTVAMVNGQWEAGAIGGTYLSAKLQTEEAKLPELLKQQGLSSSYTTRFVRVFQAQADFLVIQANDTEYMLPLMPNPSVLGLQADALATPDQVLPQLNAVVQKNLESGEIVFGGPPNPAPAETGTDTAQKQGVPNLLLYGGGAMAGLALVLVVIGSILVISGRRNQA